MSEAQERIRQLETAIVNAGKKVQSMDANDPERATIMRQGKLAVDELKRLRDAPEPEPKKAEEMRPRGSILNPLGEGILMGAGNEVASSVAAGVGTMLPERMGGFPSAPQPEGFFRAQQDIEGQLNAQRDEYAQREPMASLGAEIAASALPISKATNAITSAISGPGRSPLRRLSENVAAGGTAEAAYGFAAAPEGERGSGAAMGFAFGGPATGIFGEVGNLLAKRKATRDAASSALQAGQPETVTARWRLQEQGQGVPELVPDVPAREALRQNVPEDMILSVKSGTPKDVSVMQEMIALQKRRDANPSIRILQRPSNIAGQTVLDRVQDLQSVRKEAQEDLTGLAQRTLQGKPADVQPIMEEFMYRLDDMGIGMADDGSLDFGAMGVSEVTGNKGVQRTLEAINSVFASAGSDPDGLSVHRMKKALDGVISRASTKGSLQGQTRNIAEDMRRRLNELAQSIDSTGEYAEINGEYSRATAALEDLNEIMPSRVDLDDDAAVGTMGDLLRRLTGNQSVTREDLLQRLQRLDASAKEFGFQYDDDVVVQAAFLRDMENVFGPLADSSFGADITRAVTQGGDGGVKGRMVDAVRSQTGRMMGIDRDNAYSAIEELLRSYQP